MRNILISILFLAVLNIGASSKWAREYTDYCATAETCWRFEPSEVSDNKIVDISHNGFGATNVGGTYTTTDCGEGSCYDLDGNNDYISLGDVDIIGEISISALINLDDVVSAGNAETIVAKRDGSSNATNYAIDKETTPSDELRFYYRDAGTTFQVWSTDSANLVAGTTYHIALTYDGSTDPIMYVNGSVEAMTQDSGSANNALVANDVDARIGIFVNNNCGGNSDCELNGTIDEVMIRNDILTPTEVLDIYENGLR